MEVVNILPTPLAMVHCPFHDRMKRLVMEEIEENGDWVDNDASEGLSHICLLYTSPSPRDRG